MAKKTTSISEIVAGDNINYKGQTYQVVTVDSVTNNGYGKYTVVVTINDSGNTQITMTTADTGISSYELLSVDNSEVGTWVQSAK
jgi:translation elongation factor P/translation initiation factor 5A